MTRSAPQQDAEECRQPSSVAHSDILPFEGLACREAAPDLEAPETAKQSARCAGNLGTGAPRLRLNRRKSPRDRSMEDEESRSFGLEWRLIRWNRLRFWVGLMDPGVAEPDQPWSDVLE